MLSSRCFPAVLVFGIVFWLLFLSAIRSAVAAEPTKADIVATVQHLRALAHQAQSDAAAAKADLAGIQTRVDTLTRDLAASQAEAKLMATQAHENARERDVVLFLFAGAAALWVGTLFAGEILRDFPAPWSFVAAGGLYVVTAVAAYGLGRFLLHAAAHLIP